MNHSNQTASPWIRRFAYGSCDAACNIVAGMLSTILVLFYTDYIGLHAGIVGSIMFVSRIIDASFALFMGFKAAQTKSPLGKYRPWLLWNVFPYAFSIILLFTVPMTSPTVQYIYVFIAYNICTSLFYNTINIPYGSLGYMLTREPEERDMLSVIRTCCACTGKLLAVCGTMPLVRLWGNGKSSWIMAAVIWCIAAIILILFCFFNCKEEVNITQPPKKESVLSSAGYVFQNKYFWASAGLQISQLSYFTVTGTGLTYYCKYVLQDTGWLHSTLYLLETIVIISVMLLSPKLIRRFGKRRVALIGCLVAAASQIILLTSPTSLPLVFANSILRSAGFAPLNSVVLSFVGETAEYGYWKNNLRQESLVYATSLAFSKVGTGLTTACITGLLSLAGYISTTADVVQIQSPEVVRMITNIYVFGPLLLFLFCISILTIHRLEDKMPHILQELKAREQAR